jgi:hypothetical protein
MQGLERETAEEEARARSETEYRQGRIKLLWQELQSGDLAKVTDKELAETELVRSSSNSSPYKGMRSNTCGQATNFANGPRLIPLTN